MASRKQGTPFEIATQGISSPDGLGIATQGFIEPILGDLIFGGSALVELGRVGIITGGSAGVIRAYNNIANGGLITGGDGFITFSPRFIGSGGLVFDGAALTVFSVQPTVGGNVSLGGTANYNVLYNILATGGITTGGGANANQSYNFFGNGGLVVDGNGDINVTFTNGDGAFGGITIGGAAIVASNVISGPIIFGRGGARIPPRKRQPITVFQPPVFNIDDYLQPMDYLKKIQDVLDKAEQDKLTKLTHLSKGTVSVTGRGKIVAVFRDQPNGKMIVADNPPLTPIVLDLPHVFNKGATAREIAELEDHLFLNDIFGLGDYTIKTGPKVRYVQHSVKSTSGEARVKFVSGSSKFKLVTQTEKLQRREDDEFLLEVNMRTRQDQEQEELHMLGIID
jgi:hypothetical protein